MLRYAEFTSMPDNSVYDAIIVGSGATGGWVAKTLSEAGMQTLLLEAGPRVTDKDFTEHVQPYELKYRGDSPEIARNRPIQAMKYACRESNYHWFVDDILNPYTTPEGMPFQWTRGRQLGGRTLTWGRLSWRLGPRDFKPASVDGYGEDWPLSYEDLAPYYDRVERYVGVSGKKEGLAQIPDGSFLPPMAMNCGEMHFEKAVESKLGLPVTMARPAIVTQAHNGRAACHYCGPCEQGCITHSYFSSLWTTLVDAEKSGNCTIQTGAVCSHITTDKNTGKANGVAYIDHATRAAREARGKVVIVCCSTLESTRLLLNSGEGFCNSSGALGHYLMDHIAGSASGVIPVKEERKWVGPPRRPGGIYVPRFLNLDRPMTDGMLRGYGLQGSHSSSYGSTGSIAGVKGFGKGFKNAVREREDCWRFGLSAYAECLPQYDNFVALDPEVKDAWGIPALRIHASWGDNEMKLYRHMLDQAEEMLHAAGASEVTKQKDPRWPGGATHELGTARMGSDPKKSVVNRYRQAHDVKNIFVTDGATFPSSPCQNPTLTMMALALETSEYILDSAKRGDL
ncbi:MAG: GMC family oxidoreductase [Acidobacteria bacterium]|nr:GMC family oxidoreductase [Acidobacteriota bacterium]